MKSVLNEAVVLSPWDTKRNIPLYFELEEDADFLSITYSYTPKKLEDEDKTEEKIMECLLKDAPDTYEEYLGEKEKFKPLVNLVTISLDGPDGYVGAAHRHPNIQNHRISSEIASPGFIKTKIKKGKWCCMLNVHAVVTDECACVVEIKAGGGIYGE